MHLLHVEGSPRKQRSASIQVARTFIEAWRAHHPGGTVDTLDVWNTELPAFDGPAIDAKYAGLAGQALTPEQMRAWTAIRTLAERMHRADVLLFSVPMWNFGIPYRLKHLIDAVSQKDVLFTFDERGLVGTLTGKKMIVVAARGIALGPEYPPEIFDHQTAYMATWGRMVGITECHVVAVEKTLYGPEADTASRAAAGDEAVRLAATL
jgi:FMN-dependent NADH-azoreductase